jgi:hypothetical protein
VDIATWCDVKIGAYLDAIEERERELSEEEDDDSGEIHEWQGAAQPMPEWRQEEEVKRLFDGLTSI